MVSLSVSGLHALKNAALMAIIAVYVRWFFMMFFPKTFDADFRGEFDPQQSLFCALALFASTP
ncbi:MAG: hypothetical protein COA43_10365 [Robiginitomaculum sp.]|nr:MAG: hypothetical protein COA43_10365 [Robiginitomaculum sp.]